MSERASKGAKRVVVIGAGLSGLAAAQRLAARAAAAARKPFEVVLIDAKGRAGGAIWTRQHGGFTLEGGADSFITNKPQAVELCRELGLESRLIPTDNRYRRSFVVRQGRLAPVPEGFVLMAPNRLLPLLTTPILSARGKLRMFMEPLIPRKSEEGDESLAAFVRRRLGREVLERLVQPLVGGIYTADPADLSLKATLPQFAAMEREHGSLFRAARHQVKKTRIVERESAGARYGLFLTIDDGMETLTRKLVESLPPGTLRLNTPVRRVGRNEANDLWRVELLDGPPIDARAVLLTTESHAAARLLDGFDPELALHLRSIPYASSVIANVAYRRDQVAHPLDGFGAVVPAIENRSILAVSFTSVKFPSRAPAGTVLMRVFIGGATQPELFDLSEPEVETLIARELGELLGVTGTPLLMEIARHARAMPQYTLGHLDRVGSIRARLSAHSGLLIAGNAFDGVGIPDCIRSGQTAAEAVAELFAPAGAIAAA